MIEVDERWNGPCPCGKGRVTVTFTDYMKGYGGDEHRSISCSDCERNFSLDFYYGLGDIRMTAVNRKTGERIALAESVRK